MNDFMKRQIKLSLEHIAQYKEGHRTLNKLILSLEAVFNLDGMEVLRKSTQEKVSVLEEINAYLIEGGESSQSISVKIKEMVDEITRKLELYK